MLFGDLRSLMRCLAPVISRFSATAMPLDQSQSLCQYDLVRFQPCRNGPLSLAQVETEVVVSSDYSAIKRDKGQILAVHPNVAVFRTS